MSQEDLADRAGLDRTYISSCERGKRNISLENIYRLAMALNIEPEQLMRKPSQSQQEYSGQEL
jgi:transcriptional regulator with XRE-family HTH domain